MEEIIDNTLLENNKKLQALRLLLEQILWKGKIQAEIVNVLTFYFKNPDLFNRDKVITKAAVSGAVAFLNSIPLLQNIWYATPMDKTGGIMFVCDDTSNTDTIIVTERGNVLRAKDDIKKYMEFHKL